jgi:hypothetical protein
MNAVGKAARVEERATQVINAPAVPRVGVRWSRSRSTHACADDDDEETRE